MNYTIYDLVFEKIQEKVYNNELTLEEGELINDIAYEKYVTEGLSSKIKQRVFKPKNPKYKNYNDDDYEVDKYVPEIYEPEIYEINPKYKETADKLAQDMINIEKLIKKEKDPKIKKDLIKDYEKAEKQFKRCYHVVRKKLKLKEVR